jgi:hypothetical protein
MFSLEPLLEVSFVRKASMEVNFFLISREKKRGQAGEVVQNSRGSRSGAFMPRKQVIFIHYIWVEAQGYSARSMPVHQ